ncbi:hypothetical protein LCGC14_0385020 [marine sediment metagenome]|uniref:Uncharacterized protein n=1 Tax=marine sediment metagenome TaxID=412755 RepID=A0A0F9T164_9ZZZZ
MKTIIRLKRYRNPRTEVCVHCGMNASLGFTSYGILGCMFCQGKVDNYIRANFNIVKEGR